MKITFKLRFHTKYGQSLWLVGNHKALGNGQVEKAIPLQYLNEEFWQAAITLTLPAATAPDVEIAYNYVLREADGLTIQDRGDGRAIRPAAFKQEELLIVDAWNHEGFSENAFYTEPFQEVLLKGNHTEVQVPSLSVATHTFKVKAPLLAKGQTLCLVGDTAALGNWSTVKPILLNRTAGRNYLETQVDLSGQLFPLAYKYGVYDAEQKAFIRYEGGDNRILPDGPALNRHTIVNEGFAVLPADTWKGAGVAIPVFSLRSKNGFGIGEFEDLKLLADWCRQVGLKLMQILPVNDTTATYTWIDSYPYSAISAFALHPIYLNLNRVATGSNKDLLKELEPERKRLNALEAVDYEAVLKAKLDFIKRIYPSEKVKAFASKDYRLFFSQNRHWLVPYAAFCYLRDKYGTADFNQWPAFRKYNPEEIAGLVAENSPVYDDIALSYFIQYHLHLQLKGAMEHAHKAGVILKGDIPIGVYRHGSDVWRQPELYHAEVQAGCPPDAFSASGQNWGFPTYNWPRMRADGFAWWKQRFEQMSCYFDAFRIDHILGFFRIWSIPAHAVEGAMGYFVPAIPVEIQEFRRRGVRFDYDRFAKPYITDTVLQEIFGDEAGIVRRKFLNAAPDGQYSLKPEFATQRQVESYFAEHRNAGLRPGANSSQLETSRAGGRRSDDAGERDSERGADLKAGLFGLISNVILFEDAAGGKERFHFRFAMEDTTSFKHLEPQTQAQLKELYVDYFFRRQDDFWTREAMQKLLPLKRVTNMLVCGEDLGFVPACVPGVMKNLGLLSLEVQRMPKGAHQEFSSPRVAPYLSVVTPSSHDMSTIRGWWEEDAKCTQRFYHQELGQHGEAPRQCAAWINKAVVVQHLASPAMWSIFQLQDLLGMDEKLRRADPHAERINVPANPRHYWRYRMHLPLETLQHAASFNRELRRLIEQDGR